MSVTRVHARAHGTPSRSKGGPHPWLGRLTVLIVGALLAGACSGADTSSPAQPDSEQTELDDPPVPATEAGDALVDFDALPDELPHTEWRNIGSQDEGAFSVAELDALTVRAAMDKREGRGNTVVASVQAETDSSGGVVAGTARIYASVYDAATGEWSHPATATDAVFSEPISPNSLSGESLVTRISSDGSRALLVSCEPGSDGGQALNAAFYDFATRAWDVHETVLSSDVYDCDAAISGDGERAVIAYTTTDEQTSATRLATIWHDADEWTSPSIAFATTDQADHLPRQPQVAMAHDWSAGVLSWAGSAEGKQRIYVAPYNPATDGFDEHDPSDWVSPDLGNAQRPLVDMSHGGLTFVLAWQQANSSDSGATQQIFGGSCVLTLDESAYNCAISSSAEEALSAGLGGEPSFGHSLDLSEDGSLGAVTWTSLGQPFTAYFDGSWHLPTNADSVSPAGSTTFGSAVASVETLTRVVDLDGVPASALELLPDDLPSPPLTPKTIIRTPLVAGHDRSPNEADLTKDNPNVRFKGWGHDAVQLGGNEPTGLALAGAALTGVMAAVDQAEGERRFVADLELQAAELASILTYQLGHRGVDGAEIEKFFETYVAIAVDHVELADAYDGPALSTSEIEAAIRAMAGAPIGDPTDVNDDFVSLQLNSWDIQRVTQRLAQNFVRDAEATQWVAAIRAICETAASFGAAADQSLTEAHGRQAISVSIQTADDGARTIVGRERRPVDDATE